MSSADRSQGSPRSRPRLTGPGGSTSNKDMHLLTPHGVASRRSSVKPLDARRRSSRGSRKPSDAGETSVLRSDLASIVASGSSGGQPGDSSRVEDTSSAKSGGSNKSFSLALAKVAQIKKLVE
ncbi:hypothetical protein ElyMa_001264500 [Elysia marginata]|uniref:Uncharacterized protein n=1 Tax=Elysia marginata TaxID=1093978 RepID=A0AAV4ID96_9GAST|nr:hypothetical protein ElyMa_001264500 [Elysia marginata]